MLHISPALRLAAEMKPAHQRLYRRCCNFCSINAHYTCNLIDLAVCRWVEVSGRSTDDVLQEVLMELDKPHHEEGCGDSGRFDKATQNALKRYVPGLKIFSDADKVAAVLDWVAEAAAARRGQGGGVEADAAAAPDV